MRQLLVVNPNTVARAYRDLQVDGVVEPDGSIDGFVRLHAGDRIARPLQLLAEKDATRSRSAASIIRVAMRSFTEPPGLRYSTLA